jgi:hypothetical protein
MPRPLRNYLIMGSEGMGLFERSHLSDQNSSARVAARVAGCVAPAAWFPLSSFEADRREGRLQLRSRFGVEKSAIPSRSTNTWLTGHGDLFSNCAIQLLPKESNAPIPASRRPVQMLKPEATTKFLFRGCLKIKSQASLTFHNRSSHAALEKRPPCPPFIA